jgi:hypothetical protein
MTQTSCRSGEQKAVEFPLVPACYRAAELRL